MKKRTLLGTCLVAVLAAGALLFLMPRGEADAQTTPPSAGSQDCMYPLDCVEMGDNPCCQASECKGVLLASNNCADKAALEEGTTISQGEREALLTTTHYHMLRGAVCPSNFRLTSWGESRSLPVGGGSYVFSTGTTGTIASSHVICPEVLPDNATIYQLALYGYDNTSSGSISACLYKSYYMSSAVTSIACITSVDGGEAGWQSSTVSEPVDNGNYTYFVSSYVTPGKNSDLKIYTVEVRYTTP
jgi:hypothetical protein